MNIGAGIQELRYLCRTKKTKTGSPGHVPLWPSLDTTDLSSSRASGGGQRVDLLFLLNHGRKEGRLRLALGVLPDWYW